MERLCDCDAPELCTCHRPGIEFVRGPYDFAKLHGCFPDRCKCAGEADFRDSFDAGLYLSAMLKVVEAVFSEVIELVNRLIRS